MPFMDFPSIVVMMSPEMIPAFIAGESSIGVTTTTLPFWTVISMPTPWNLPVVISLSSSNAFSSRKREKGSFRELIIPLIAP